MFQKYESLNIYDNSSIVYLRKQSSKIISWFNILIIGSILFCIIGFKYKYSISNIYYAKVIHNDEENYISIDVDEDFLLMKNRNYLNIDDEDYKCHLLSFSDNYYVVNSQKHWVVNFDCNIPDDINVNNNLVEIKLEKRKTTLFKEISTKIRKRVKKWKN